MGNRYLLHTQYYQFPVFVRVTRDLCGILLTSLPVAATSIAMTNAHSPVRSQVQVLARERMKVLSVAIHLAHWKLRIGLIRERLEMICESKGPPMLRATGATTRRQRPSTAQTAFLQVLLHRMQVRSNHYQQAHSMLILQLLTEDLHIRLPVKIFAVRSNLAA